jgi:hypothetical protein
VSAYPVPAEVEFFFGRSPGALLQLDLLRVTPDRPEASAASSGRSGASTGA